jgi:dTDP-4-dehydro-6-deoxy-alpha-D-glucopyranose 2,3-dehydratase
MNPWLRSARALEGSHIKTSDVHAWIDHQRAETRASIEHVPVRDLTQWRICPETKQIDHVSGRFFSIAGIDVQFNMPEPIHWQQPVILQPEIGTLGCIAQRINGILHLLIQAKIEPGNINLVQLSPTIQATKSNYTQVHKGRLPAYFEHFEDLNRARVHTDQLQSEQGARFLRKKNRNCIIELPQQIEAQPGFVWLTLGQLKTLAAQSNTLNMNLRSVLSSIDRDEPADTVQAYSRHNDVELLSWVTSAKNGIVCKTLTQPMDRLEGWDFDDMGARHVSGRYFNVHGINVQIDNREATHWDQPIISPGGLGLVVLFQRWINGTAHYLMQATVEFGLVDYVEISPTIVCDPDNYDDPERSVPYLQFFNRGHGFKVIHTSLQSEEGGRFFQEQNRHCIIRVDETFPIEAKDQFRWMTRTQIVRFLKFSGQMTVQTRSIITLLPEDEGRD